MHLFSEQNSRFLLTADVKTGYNLFQDPVQLHLFSE